MGSPRRWVTRLGKGRVETRLPDFWPSVRSVFPPFFPFLPPSAQWAGQRWATLVGCRGLVRQIPPPAAPPARPLVEAGTVPGAGPCGRALSQAWVILGSWLPHRIRSWPPSPHEQLPCCGGRRPPGPRLRGQGHVGSGRPQPQTQASPQSPQSGWQAVPESRRSGTPLACAGLRARLDARDTSPSSSPPRSPGACPWIPTRRWPWRPP